jgi:septal ring factor EnvC (AmiA/AmiB activator)
VKPTSSSGNEMNSPRNLLISQSSYAVGSTSQLPSGKDLRLEDITPQMLAKIVHHYILPMFESKSTHKPTSSMYCELKLSEQLEGQLSAVTSEMQDLRLAKDEFASQHATNLKQISDLKAQIKKLKLGSKELKQRVKMLLVEKQRLDSDIQEFSEQRDFIMQFAARESATNRVKSSEFQRNLGRLDQLESVNTCMRSQLLYQDVMCNVIEE